MNRIHYKSYKIFSKYAVKYLVKQGVTNSTWPKSAKKKRNMTGLKSLENKRESDTVG